MLIDTLCVNFKCLLLPFNCSSKKPRAHTSTIHLVDIFLTIGVPNILHSILPSNNGRKFENTVIDMFAPYWPKLNIPTQM